MRVLLVAATLTAQVLAAQAPPAPPDTGDPRAALFVARGCSDCHAVVALGLKAKTDAGPDLTYAYSDVQDRYGLTLECFFERPAGVMRLVLGGHVQLSKGDSDSLVSILRALYFERLAGANTDSDGRATCAAPHRPGGDNERANTRTAVRQSRGCR